MSNPKDTKKHDTAKDTYGADQEPFGEGRNQQAGAGPDHDDSQQKPKEDLAKSTDLGHAGGTANFTAVEGNAKTGETDKPKPQR